MFRLLLVLALVVGMSPAAFAGENPDIAIALHVSEPGGDCINHGVADCFQIVTSWLTTGVPVDFYVFICGHGWTGPHGFMTARYGLLWPEEWLFVSWRSCVEFPVGQTMGTITRPGDCVYQEFVECQPPLGAPVAVGILTVTPTSAGAVSVIPHGGTCTAEVGDCMGGIDVVLPTPMGNGRAGFVNVGMLSDGCNPCPCVGDPCYTSLGENPDGGIALHGEVPGFTCTDHPVFDCFQIVTAISGEVVDIFVFICGHGWNADSHGFQSAHYGLAWTENLSFLNWVPCADYTYGTIAQEGDGVYQIWYDCNGPAGHPVAAGILTLRADGPGRVSVFEHPGCRCAGIGDCVGGANIVHPPESFGNGRAGWVDVNMIDGLGCNPCPCVGPPCYPATDVEAEQRGDSWSHIKTLFR